MRFEISVFQIKNPHQRLQKCLGTAHLTWNYICENCVLKKNLCFSAEIPLQNEENCVIIFLGCRLSGCIGCALNTSMQVLSCSNMASRLFFYNIVLFKSKAPFLLCSNMADCLTSLCNILHINIIH